MADFMIRPEHFGATVFERKTLSYFYVTHTQLAAIWIPAEGQRLGLAAVERDLSGGRFAEFCRQLDAGASWVRCESPPPLPAHSLAAPVRVYFEVTRGCNLHCRYCLNRSGVPLPGELSTAEVLRTIAELGRAGAFEVRITGGEPPVRPDFGVIAPAVRTAGMALSLNSNLQHDAATIAGLVALRPDLVITSLDAAREPHTAARGRGFDQIVHNIKVLRAEGVPLRLNCTLNQRTIPHLAAFVDAFAPIGCGFCFILTRPVGRAAATFQPPPLDDLLAAVQVIKNRQAAYPHCYFSTSFDVVMDHELEVGGINLTGCNAVQKSFNINSDGAISPCAFLYELDPAAYGLGNVRDEGYSILRVWRDSMRLQELRQRSCAANRRCIQCAHFKQDCLGSCVFMQCYSQRTGQVDPYCRLSLAGSPADGGDCGGACCR
jgi:MoaA/NifB/PqqE/SkfB family radical SAM enzyme